MKSILEFINNQQTSFKNLNPNQFLDFMKDIKYDNVTDEDGYIIKTPQELLRTKKGICYDQVELEREYFTSNNYEFKTFFAYQLEDGVENNQTHTFLIYKDNGKYFWFENSWESYKGIMGPFSSYNEAVDFVKKQFIISSKWKMVTIKEYDKFNYSKMNINQFSGYIINTKKISYQQTPIYHYVFNMKNLDNILKIGKLLTINQLVDTNKEDYNIYLKRDIDYLETTYNKFYKDVLNTPYNNNYGIYLTPVDLFSFPNELTHRFIFTINDLDLSKTVIKVKSNIQLLTQKNLIQTSQKYSNPKEIEKIYNSSSLKFLRLPQIVTFVDYLKVSKNNLQIRNRS